MTGVNSLFNMETLALVVNEDTDECVHRRWLIHLLIIGLCLVEDTTNPREHEEPLSCLVELLLYCSWLSLHLLPGLFLLSFPSFEEKSHWCCVRWSILVLSTFTTQSTETSRDVRCFRQCITGEMPVYSFGSSLEMIPFSANYLLH